MDLLGLRSLLCGLFLSFGLLLDFVPPFAEFLRFLLGLLYEKIHVHGFMRINIYRTLLPLCFTSLALGMPLISRPVVLSTFGPLF